MRIIFITTIVLLMGCGAVTDAVPAMSNRNTDNRVEYFIVGDAIFVDIAFCSSMGARDTIPGVMLPLFVSFDLPEGETAFMRVHKTDPDDIVVVGIKKDGFTCEMDTARPGDELAEVYSEAW